MKFEDLDLNDNVLDALYDMRFSNCTPIQKKCIPEILKGKDILGVAQTGTGKTAAYLLPILSKLADGGYPENCIHGIIMAPTRELAQQIDQSAQGFAYYLNNISCVAVYGGNDGNRYEQEIKSLKLGTDLIIATPGRFISHISLGNVDLSKVSFFVLDEADRMLDMGFADDIMTIFKKLPSNCQIIMFSATFPEKIEQLAKHLLKNPSIIKLSINKPAKNIKQLSYICYETQKLEIIKNIFQKENIKRVIIFSSSKQKVKQIVASLKRKNIKCGEMHSDLSQEERNNIMYKFKSNQIDVLVATDIIARGIDIDDISMVINYDVPHEAEDYVHRIGRTARAEKKGIAITFVNEDDMNSFNQIENSLNTEIKKAKLPKDIGTTPIYHTIKAKRKTGYKQENNNSRKEQNNKKQTKYKKDSKKYRENTNNKKSKNKKIEISSTNTYKAKIQQNKNKDNSKQIYTKKSAKTTNEREIVKGNKSYKSNKYTIQDENIKTKNKKTDIKNLIKKQFIWISKLIK